VAVLAGLAAPAQAQSSAADGKRAAQRSGKPAKAKAAAVQTQGQDARRGGGRAGSCCGRRARCSGIRPGGPSPADYIVAVVNTEPITNNEVRARVARACARWASAAWCRRPPPACASRCSSA
jgi:hypothetical protein